MTIANFSSSDKGIYTCEISNSMVTDLVLVSHPIHATLTGIYQVNKTSGKIFPNPSNGQFNIGLEKNPGKNCELEVLDLNGKAVHQQKLTQIESKINLEGKQGTYLLQIIDGNEVYGVYKLLIQE